MKNILILGAGKSSSSLIKYLSLNAEQYNWNIVVADQSEDALLEKTRGLTRTTPALLTTGDLSEKYHFISKADLVLSMLPPFMHLEIAHSCIDLGKPLITASYLTDEIQQLHAKLKNKGIAIFMEMGLDPGIDHMSALKEIDAIRNKGGKITSFKSYTGGLVAPESDNNPWNYKITWNPRNVVLAGQGTVKYLADGKFKYIPYQSVFSRLHKLTINPYGEFEGYANRDSLKYLHTYGLENVSTFIRGTLRRPGYCKAWNALVQTGLTDDSFIVENSQGMTYKEFVESFLSENSGHIEKDFFLNAKIDADSPEAEKIRWLGLFSQEKIVAASASPAKILQEIIEKKWALDTSDKDLIVMQHEITYTQDDKSKKVISSMGAIGEDRLYTAMAKTVGLPMGILAKLILTDQLQLSGVHIPVSKNIYIPVLKELEEAGIHFNIHETDD